jgi:hypothetical protein
VTCTQKRCVCWSVETTVCRIFSCRCLHRAMQKLFDRLSGMTPPPRLRRSGGQAVEACPPKRAAAREGGDPRQTSLPVVIGSGSHPFPFRTRKLSLIPPMVLYGKLYGRVGRCRHYLQTKRPDGINHRGVCLYGASFVRVVVKKTAAPKRHRPCRGWRHHRVTHTRRAGALSSSALTPFTIMSIRTGAE